METLTLNNGVKIPKLALGTWEINDNQVAQVVETAVQPSVWYFLK